MKPRVLILDDDPIIIKAISEALKHDYRIAATTTSSQAMRILNSDDPPELILLDVVMPEVDGVEFCRRIKANTRLSHIPVIFITSMTGDTEESRGLMAGAVDYITKPVIPAIVRARARTHILLNRKVAELNSAYQIIESQKLRMEQELDVGRNLQLSLLPEMPEGEPHFSVSAAMKAAYEVSGDFYDAFWITKNRLCVCIGDVSGKGVPAALFMSMSQSLVRSRADLTLSPAQITTEINRSIATKNPTCMFFTLFIAILDIRTGEMVYTNAGHTRPLIIRGQQMQPIADRHGPAIGVIPSEYTESKVTLSPEDILFLYTDGITESKTNDDELLGENGLMTYLKSTDTRSLDAFTRTTVESFDNSDVPGASDDITVLALRFKGCKTVEPEETTEVAITSASLARLHHTDQLDEVLSTFSLEKQTASTYCIALDEIISNIITHGFPNSPDEIEISVRIASTPTRLKITIVDSGIPFDPTKISSPSLNGRASEREPGGLGLHLCRQLMDSMDYERKNKKNHLQLIKRFVNPVDPTDPEPPAQAAPV